MPAHRVAVPLRFWSKVARPDENGCWNWTAGMSSNGYGGFALTHRRSVSAHRMAYELVVGPIPEGLTIDHLCRNRRCVNPAHLEVVTMGENVRRGETVTGENARKTHCKRGHLFDEANTYVAPSGGRACRTCARERMREHNDAHTRYQRDRRARLRAFKDKVSA